MQSRGHPIRSLRRSTNKEATQTKPKSRSGKKVFGLYSLFFAVLLSPAIKGAGQYWDWVFPYYGDQIGNFFTRASEAWTADASGSPLGYSTDYFLRFVISLLRLPFPEIVLYLLLVGICAGGAYGVYIIARKHTRGSLAFLLGLVAFVNPIIFYNFIAGYINYLVAYTVFIYLIYFLFYKYKPDMRSAVIVGLLVTAIGVQIQLFFVAAALIGIFFFFRSEDFRLRHAAVMLGSVLLLSLVWLSNFLFGGADLAGVSGTAAKGAFKGLTDTNYLSIFNFSFSKATLISRFYDPLELLLYGLFFVVTVAALLRAKRKQPDDVGLLAFMLLMLFLSTGLFQVINLGPLTMLYPMFREVGHFAPMLILAMIVSLARLMPSGVAKGLCFAWLAVVILISFVKFQVHTPALDFGSIRSQFAEFKQFGDAHQDSEHRVFFYPFFEQYSFVKFPQSFQSNLPLRNSGHESFSTFNQEQFVKNAVKPHEFKQSVQYRLLQTLDVGVLEPYNIRYIYDFSGIYESYYDRYVPPATYNSDISLIKNNPDFMDQLLAVNPGKLKRVSPHILELTNYTPRLASNDRVYAVSSMEDGERSRPFMEKMFPKRTFNYVVSPAAQTPPASSSVTSLFSDASDPQLLNTHAKQLQQTLHFPLGSDRATVYANNMPNNLSYRVNGGVMSFYISSAGKLYADGKLMQDNDTTTAKEVGHLPVIKGKQFYAILNGDVVPLRNDGGGSIGHLDGESVLELYVASGENLISNPSFESGLWRDKVDDCNAYDSNANIHMDLNTAEHSDGKQSLELSAVRHDACTFADVNMKGGATYILGYDYQSPNASSASFYFRFNNSDTDAVKRFQTITGSQWHTTTQLITAPPDVGRGQITVHATASDGPEPTINRYDNFTMMELTRLGQVTIPAIDNHYATYQLPAADATTLSFTDASYDYRNIIQNGSFEQGPWQGKATDCNNYDKNGNIGVSVTRSAKTEGAQALQLEATRHTACEYVNATVKAGSDYLLSFDYQGDEAERTGYYLEFNGVDRSTQDQLPITDRAWHTYSTKIHAPEIASGLRLYLHAYESDGKTKNTVRFDNVRLIAVPSVEQQFYVVSEPKQPLKQPQHLSFHSLSPTRRAVRVTGASAPFTLSLSETYHKGWRLELDNAKVAGLNSWRPGVSADVAADHFRINNYANGWYVNPAELCAGEKQGCHKRPDGSYDIELIAEFVPARWFTVNRAISVGTLVVACGYVAFTHRRRSKDEEGVYRHPLAVKRRK